MSPNSTGSHPQAPHRHQQPTAEQVARSRRTLTLSAVIFIPAGVAFLVLGLVRYSALAFILGLTLLVSGVGIVIVRPLLFPFNPGRRLIAIGVLLAFVIVVTIPTLVLPGPIAARGTADPVGTAERALEPSTELTFGSGDDVLVVGQSADDRHLTYDLDGATVRSIDLVEGERTKTSAGGRYVYVFDGQSTRAYDMQGNEFGSRPGEAIAFHDDTVVMRDNADLGATAAFDPGLETQRWELPDGAWTLATSGPSPTLQRMSGDSLNVTSNPYTLPEHLFVTGPDSEEEGGAAAVEFSTGRIVPVDGLDGLLSTVHAVHRDGAVIELHGTGGLAEVTAQNGSYTAQPIPDLPAGGRILAVGATFVVTSDRGMWALADGEWTELPIDAGEGSDERFAAFATDGTTLLTYSGRTARGYAIDVPGAPLLWEGSDLPCRTDAGAALVSVGHGTGAVVCRYRNPVPLAVDRSTRTIMFDADDGTELARASTGSSMPTSIAAIPHGVMQGERPGLGVDPADEPALVFRAAG